MLRRETGIRAQIAIPRVPRYPRYPRHSQISHLTVYDKRLAIYTGMC